MAFLHCHECGWSQDDFWSKEYNPIRCLLDNERDLLENDFDEPVSYAHELPQNINTKRDLLLFNLRQTIKIIENMKYRTYEEWNNQPCPECGAKLCLD